MPSRRAATGTALSFLFLVVLLVLRNAHGAQPGAKACLTTSAFHKACAVAVPILERALLSADIPNVSGTVHPEGIRFDYEMSNIRIESFTIGSFDIGLTDGGLDVRLSGISIHIHLDWHYRQHTIPHLKDSGSADASVGGSTAAAVVISIGLEKGRPSVSADSVAIDLDDFSIHLHGGASWFYNLIEDLFKGTIRSSVRSSAQKTIVKTINGQAEAALKTLPVIVQIDDIAEIDYELVGAPAFSAGKWMCAPDRGEFYRVGNHSEAPYTPAVLPNTLDEHMVQFFLGDYVIDTASYVYYSAGALQTRVTQSDLPHGFPIAFNTSDLRYVIPQLYDAFPNDAFLLSIAATLPPIAELSSEGLNVTLVGDVALVAVTPNKTEATAFVVMVEIATDVSVSVNGTSLSFAMEFLNSNISLAQSQIGPVDVQPLSKFINSVAEYVVLPVINELGSKGLPIPTIAGVGFVDPAVSLGDGYIAVLTDIEYSPDE